MKAWIINPSQKTLSAVMNAQDSAATKPNLFARGLSRVIRSSKKAFSRHQDTTSLVCN